MKNVWIVDDDRSIRWVLEKALQKADIPCKTFSEAESVLQAIKKEQPALILSDIHMPGKSGLEMLAEIKKSYPKLPIIIMTAYSDLDSAVASFQGGAFEYLPKPFDIDKAIELVRRATEESEEEEQTPAEETASEIIGKAPAMQEVFRAIGRLSQSKATVLLTGESGAGKEVVARALHKHSPRSNAPFVAINMAAIPKDLMETELFGHEKGAFTGASAIRHGRFEQAEGGTLFLDEIGDMPAELQTRLLRVLSDGYYYRVGGHQSLKANVRVIGGNAPKSRGDGSGKSVPRGLVSQTQCHSSAFAALKGKTRRHSAFGQSFSSEVSGESWCRTQAHVRRGDGVFEAFPVSRQCSSIRKSLQLACRDGTFPAYPSDGSS